MRPLARARSGWKLPTLLVTCAALAGCGIRGASSVDNVLPGRVLMAEDIEKLGVRNAWEVLKRVGLYTTQESQRGVAKRLWRRGRGSIVLDESPLIVVDGAKLDDPEVLQHIDVRTIELMRLLNSVEGTHFYGALGGGGAILIETRHTIAPERRAN
jgi:hypothetical protein